MLIQKNMNSQKLFINFNKIFSCLIRRQGTLSQRVTIGSIWVFFFRISNRLIELTRLLILARLLSPNDFGLMGIALLILSTLETFSQTGLSQALIQRNGEILDYLNTAWTLTLFRSIIIASTLFLISPLVAAFFNSPEILWVIRAISITIVLDGISNIGVIYFQKELLFQKEFIYQVSGSIANLIVSVSAAFMTRNVWAIVVGLIASSVIKLIVSYLIHSFRPRFEIDWKKARELFSYGKFIFARSIMIFLLVQGDDAFVGKFLGAATLGYYQLAYRLSNISATEITNVISRVTFPAFSKIQKRTDLLKTALFKTLRYGSLLSFPIAAGIAVLSPEIVQVLLGERWLPMIPAMQILAFFGALRSVSSAFSPVYQALARLEIPLRINFFQLVVMALTIYPFTMWWGITGTSMAVTLMLLSSLYFFVDGAAGVINTSTGDLLKNLSQPLFASIGMGVVILLIKPHMYQLSGILTLISLILIGVISYPFIYLVVYLIAGNSRENFNQEIEDLLQLLKLNGDKND